MTPPRRAMVTRRMFALIVALLVVMMAAEAVALELIAPTGLTPAQVGAQVKHEIQHEIDTRADARDRQTCQIVASLPRTRSSDKVRHQLHCHRALHPTPAPTTTATAVVVRPTPGPTMTKTVITTRPGPTRTVTRTPQPRCTNPAIRKFGCPTIPPVPTPTLHLH